jgi:endonuclease YncB( thermonuclease family)
VTAEIVAGPGWEWPVARLIEVHDGDTVKLAVDHGFGEDAKEWVRLRDVWAPELDDEGGPQAKADCDNWFREYAPDGLVKVTTFRTSAPLEIRMRMSFTRYIGIVTAPNGAELNSWLIDKGYVTRGAP